MKKLLFCRCFAMTESGLRMRQNGKNNHRRKMPGGSRVRDHWSQMGLVILRDLANGPQRFGQLEHSIKVSPRILSMRLQELESEGFITRTSLPRFLRAPNTP